ncbi:MAG: phosphoribosylformylglycinamidine cyclo-ligase [Spirochaetia bacterium]|nr:phosphoribosylformylglycinamidine cyclo-ligase [Spirochaetia bacterium]
MEGSEAYKKAGVDTEKGQEFVGMIRNSVKSTHSKFVMDNYGSFSGLFDASFLKDYKNPVLLSATDGVGTKLKLASLFQRHDTIGIDLVAMCSNDILVSGGRPLFFLDYISCGKLNPAIMTDVVESIAEGCRRCGASLTGGETAEHPDTMHPDEYDLGGFMVGCAEKEDLIDGRNIAPGDVILSIPSTGIHSNGMSLVRKLFLKNGLELPDSAEEKDFLLNEILLKPTAIYEKALRPILEKNKKILGIVHVTGGGFYENIPRILPENTTAVIKKADLTIPEAFQRIQKKGGLSDREMMSVFNMGTGLAVIVSQTNADEMIEELQNGVSSLPDSFSGKVVPAGFITEQNGNERVIIQ